MVALLVVRPTLPLTDDGQRVLHRLQPFLIAEAESANWPGTLLHGTTARVLQFSILPSSAAVLKSVVSGLYGWQQPDRPEDLCLLRADGTPSLVSIAHEADAYFELDRAGRAALLQALPAPRAIVT